MKLFLKYLPPSVFLTAHPFKDKRSTIWVRAPILYNHNSILHFITMSATEKPQNTDPGSPANKNSDQPATYTGIATSAAGTAAETATNAAVGVRDTMFSMFGGGEKKEVKDEKITESEEDRSGSAKAIKEKEKEKEDTRGREEQEEGVLSP